MIYKVFFVKGIHIVTFIYLLIWKDWFSLTNFITNFPLGKRQIF